MQKEIFVSKINKILGLDQESAEQIFEHLKTVYSNNEVAKYLNDLLGDSPEAIEFISIYISSRWPSRSKKIDEPPSRESFINTKSNSSTLTADLLTNKNKARPNVSKNGKSKLKVRKEISSLSEIESAIREIESEIYGEQNKLDEENYTNNNDNNKKRIVCDCQARKHPLQEVAPNCLSCGKIICVVEGLRPCSFCGSPLISRSDAAAMLEFLEKEKQSINAPNSKKNFSKGGFKNSKETVIKYAGASSVGGLFDYSRRKNPSLNNDKNKNLNPKSKSKSSGNSNSNLIINNNKNIRQISSAQIEKDLEMAEKRRDTLLNFQSTGAQRTKIIDAATDFDYGEANGSNSTWMSPAERALSLKQQQRKQRIAEKREKKGRVGYTKQVISIDLKGKKVMLVEEDKEDDETELEDEEEQKLKQQVENESQTQYKEWEGRKNKKIQRPIWKENEKKSNNTSNDISEENDTLYTNTGYSSIIQDDYEDENEEIFSL